MENCPYCGSPNIILKENGEYVCASCGSVLGVRYDEGYGDSPSLTRREYFAQFQPGNVRTISSSLKERLRSMIERVDKWNREDLVNYFISNLSRSFKSMIFNDARQIINQYLKPDFDTYEIAYLVYAVLLNLGVPVSEKQVKELLKKINGDINPGSLRRARRLVISLGLSLVLNREACLLLIAQRLGLTHAQIAKALQILNRVQGPGKPLAIVLRSLYEIGIPIQRLSTVLEIPEPEIYKMLTNTRTRKTESHNSNDNDDGHLVTMQKMVMIEHGHQVTIGKVINLVVYDNGSNYLVFTRDIPPKNIKQIEVEIEELNLRLRLRKVKYKRKYVIGRRISGDIAEQLYRYYNTNGPIKARVVSCVLESSRE